MQCPQCNNGLRTVTHRGVEIETCSICHGIWFDSHEVLRYLNRLVHDPDSQNYFKKVNSPHKPVTEAGFCPKCNQILEFDYIGESALHFQKCVNCSGIWLDRRNLKPLALWYASASSMEQITLFGTMKEQSFDIKKGSISKGLLNLYVDENPVRNFPWATLLLVLVNTMIFLVSLAFKEAATAFYLVPNELYKAPHTIVTSMFMHASIFHLLGNMYCLWIFGDNIEDRLGKMKYLLIYLGTGICGAIAHIYTTANPNIPVLGASGAVSGIMGAYLVLYPGVRIKVSKFIFPRWPIEWTLPAWFYIGIFFGGLNALWGWLDIPGVAWFAHTGGLAAGSVAMRILRLFNML